AWIERLRSDMPELPETKRQRYVGQYGLTAERAMSLTATPALAEVFEATVNAPVDAQVAANWVVGEYAAAAHQADIDPGDAPVSGAELGALLKRIQDGTISGKIAKEVFDAMWAGEGSADAIIDERGLKQISDAGAIEKIVEAVLTANPAAIIEYKSGKEKA